MAEELHTHLPVGTRIDHFILDEVIGTGGFSMTYLAHDERLNRKVAIKEYFPSLAVRAVDGTSVGPRSGTGDEYRAGLEKFLEEARLLAQFNHPNIVRAISVLPLNNTAYLVMEFMNGETLAQRLARVGKLAETDLKSLLSGLLDGLAEVHQRDFMHRDIKPANIYLSRDDTPVLLDFGAARYAVGEHSQSMTGIVSVGYAPAEQYSTSSRNQGPWSDLYALGATLYECAVGSKPVGSLDRREALVEGAPDPLIPAVEKGAGLYNASLLQSIDWMLRQISKERPQSVSQLRERLGGVLDADSNASGVSPAVAKEVAPGNAATAAVRTSDETILVQPTTKSRQENRYGKWFAATAVVLLLLFVFWGGEEEPVSDTASELVSTDLRPESIPDAVEDAKPAAPIMERKPEPVVAKFPLTIRTAPTNAQVRILNIRESYVPGVELAEGRYEVQVSAREHETVQRWISLSERQRTFEFALTQKRYPLTIQAEPASATIRFPELDATYTAGMKLPAGGYVVELSADGYAPSIQTVTVNAQSQAHTLKLETKKLPLTVKVEPVDAWIRVLNIGPTYQPGMALKPGRYHIEVSKSGYKRIRKWVELAANEQEFEFSLQAAGRHGRVFQDRLKDGSLGPKMVVIPAGQFRMGDLSGEENEKPVHKVTISKRFAMGKFEVTVGQFRKFIASTSYRASNFERFGKGAELPAVNISWNDASAYVQWLSDQTGKTYRLPSEAEWEYAARAGSTTKYPWGNEIDASRARFSSWSATSVGRYPANAFGLHDMIGNVWEWVADCWHDNYRGAPSDGSAWVTGGDCSRRVLRGGSWFSPPLNLRSANRFWVNRANRLDYVGFRLLQDF